VKSLPSLIVLVVACVDVGSSEVVVDRVVNVDGFAIEERIVREPTFHDPIYDHRWRVRVDGAWSELGTLRIEHARGIEADRPPRVIDGHLAVPVGPQVLFRMRDGHTERADTHGCPATDPVYGLWVRSIARRDGRWHIVFEPTTGHDTPAVEVRGGGSTWTCVLLDEGG
jgi:hypothetical protein